MFNLSGSEMVFLLLIALVVLGPEKLPEAVRKFGKTYGEIKKMSSGFQSELRDALDEPMREMRETADTLRQAVSVDFEPMRLDGDATSNDDRDASPPAAAAASNGVTSNGVTGNGVTSSAVTGNGVTSRAVTGNGVAAPTEPSDEVGAGEPAAAVASMPSGDFAPMLPDDALPDVAAHETSDATDGE